MLLLVILVNLTPIQNFVARKTAEVLAERLKTKVALKNVRIDFLNHLLIEGLYIEDHAGDTLLYAGRAEARITDWFILRKDKPVIHYIGLYDAYGHLYRTAKSGDWNYQFVIDAFDTGKKDSTKKQNELELDLKKLDVQRARFHMDDAWAGSDLDINIGNLQVNADAIDIKKRKIDIRSILVEQALVSVRDYKGGRPSTVKKKVLQIDTTAFNKGNWLVSVRKINLHRSAFALNSSDRPPAINEFDPSHIGVSDINIDVNNLKIVKDTIRGAIENLTAKERCGLVVKKFTADASVSPIASICKNLYLETNNSKLQHYYAMHYDRFPDFTDYIHKVKMVGDISNSVVDSRDVAYFAPVLRKYPEVLHISGNVAGTVDNLQGENLYVTDGSTYVKGDLKMQGLPDINTTFINFQNGAVFTTSNFILKYAPELRNNPSIAVEKINYAYYQGNFAGYIENFAANGTLTTNLGSIQSDIKLYIPNLNSKVAVYSGAVSTEHFALGTLLRQPLFGDISFKANVSGAAFDPQNASVKIDGFINYLDVKGYRYKNISAEGTLAKKKFDGKALVDDPNLALAFYGSADFSGAEMNINAKANLLQSNLNALNLTKDSILATADFDLDFTGNNIDNFQGYAKLYNINLVRNNHRLDVDSVYASSAFVDGKKSLILESNDITAHIKGDYQLSTLPRSVQFYISGYLPNYIQAPVRYAPDQNLSFSFSTRNIDSLLAVLLPSVKGFNDATVSGALNTAQQQLTLTADIPYGYFKGIALNKVKINATGNFNLLSVDADIANLDLNKGLLSASMSVNTQLGSDSMNFVIATKSPDAIGTLTINGRAVASGDSLYLNLLPSEFYLNKNRWEIPDGNQFVFSKDYLFIKNLKFSSGLQNITVNTSEESTNQLLAVTVKDLDVAMLGGIAGLAPYQPDGRINGSVNFANLFTGMMVDGNLQATNVKLGQDTLGTINLIGNYNAKKKIVSLDPQSGIYRGNASIRAAGSVSFDSTNRQLLDGYVQFNQSPLSWISPLVTGFLSNMSGTLNGNININGSAAKPDIAGTVTVNDAATKIDIIGTYYRIPHAELKVDNNSIDFGKVTIYDVANRTATLTGGIAHDRFRNMRFSRVTLQSPEFEALNLKEYENNSFYGNLVAEVESMTISGPFDDIRMSITASPAAKSHIFIPVKTTADVGSYSYVSFKTYGQDQVVTTKGRNKFSLTIIGKMNPLAEMTLVLDPSTGDVINAKGYGTIQLNVPSDADIKMYGNYEIEEGDYTFTLRQLAFRRNFVINSGSKIGFNGALSSTNLDINAVYTTRARLIDLLNEKEKDFISNTSEERDAKASQKINVLLHMTGSLNEPKLTFNLDVPENRSEGSLAYQKLKQINQNDRELFDQVASLLLVNTFIPPEGIGSSTATTGAINNISEILSTTASSQLTNIVNKLLGDPNLSVELKYKNYNLSDPTIYGGALNRNEVSFNVRKNLLNDRLMVELGSAYDWGRPTSSNSSTSNLTGDFRVQYLLTEDGRVRATVFRTSNYDVLVDRNIWRGGIGISYRKTFDNLYELLHRPKPPVSGNSNPVPNSDTTAAAQGS
ncbi:MAG TPA: translocation/assembly module TamB domain-containing protein [Flavipsychrobacter sp.]|nr:translocation/assembly module TamB domain-containing protein [Flavipsychrobacter sp.]